MLYMSMVVAKKHNPMIRRMYRRLLARGKPPKVALIACMRKLIIYLNAMIRDQKTWEQFIQTS